MDAILSSGTNMLAIGSTDLLVPAGLALITLAMLMRYRKRRVQLARSTRLTPHEEVERAQQVRGLRGDLEQLMVEVEQLAKRFATQLDAKSIEMQGLMQQADERIAQLKQAVGQEATDQTMDLGPAPVTYRDDGSELMGSVDLAATMQNRDALTHRIYALADAGMAAADIANELHEQIGEVELILALREAG